MNKLTQSVSQLISFILHPLLIPSWGFLLLSHSGFYFSLLPWALKKYLLLVVFISTCVLPAIGMGILALTPKAERSWRSTDRILPLLISSVFYYMGFLVLEKLPIFPIYNLFLIAAILVQIALIIISLKWNISLHAAAIGALLGGFIALSVRMQENPVLILTSLILAAGLIATSRLILLKHTNGEVYSGFLIGFVILSMVVVFI